MSKTPPNSGKPWTSADIAQLRVLVKGNTPTRLIARDLGRTPGAVQTAAAERHISLKPTNQSPYGTKKK